MDGLGISLVLEHRRPFVQKMTIQPGVNSPRHDERRHVDENQLPPNTTIIPEPKPN